LSLQFAKSKSLSLQWWSLPYPYIRLDSNKVSRFHTGKRNHKIKIPLPDQQGIDRHPQNRIVASRKVKRIANVVEARDRVDRRASKIFLAQS
jgi:hypothetical protein